MHYHHIYLLIGILIILFIILSVEAYKNKESFVNKSADDLLSSVCNQYSDLKTDSNVYSDFERRPNYNDNFYENQQYKKELPNSYKCNGDECILPKNKYYAGADIQLLANDGIESPKYPYKKHNEKIFYGKGNINETGKTHTSTMKENNNKNCTRCKYSHDSQEAPCYLKKILDSCQSCTMKGGCFNKNQKGKYQCVQHCKDGYYPERVYNKGKTTLECKPIDTNNPYQNRDPSCFQCNNWWTEGGFNCKGPYGYSTPINPTKKNGCTVCEYPQ